jgi:hypothetical protein
MSGKKSNSRKMIIYTAEYNRIYHNETPLTCNCLPDNYVKYVVGSDSPSIKVSNNMRTSQIVNYSKGGTSQFGNFYLGQPLNINYLGRMEGMPGGSGSAPKNSFN